MSKVARVPSAGERLQGFDVEITAERVRAYADAASDHNPIHLDPEFAATMPFGGTIAHGMLLLAYLARLMTMRFGAAWLQEGTLSARFRAPARVGTRVRASGLVRSVAARGDQTIVECELQVSNSEDVALVTATAQVMLHRGQDDGQP